MPTKGTKYPITIKHGSASVKVYRVKRASAKSGYVYPVAWYDSKGVRDQRQYHGEQEAIKQAKKKAKELVSRGKDAELVRWEHKEAYVAAQAVVGEIPLLSVAKEWKKAHDLTGGSIIPAAQAWKNQHGGVTEVYTLSEVIKRFLKDKKADGINTKASYDRSFPAFQKAFGEEFISSVTARDLQAYLNKSYKHPVTRNTHRKRVVTLFTWSQNQGYLPRNVKNEAELTNRAKEPPQEIGIISPDVFSDVLKLIHTKHSHYLAALVLSGFCGLRRVEIQGQHWEDIHLDRKLVRVTVAKAGTRAKRLIALCDAAIKWLSLCEKRSGKVCKGTTQQLDRIRFIGRNAGLKLPANCFRHSFISSRIAATGEVGHTALEAGKSEDVIHKHYRELVAKEEGEDWFKITPGG